MTEHEPPGYAERDDDEASRQTAGGIDPSEEAPDHDDGEDAGEEDLDESD